jgi:acetoin utilization deacetylase AcuC-like enzyme
MLPVFYNPAQCAPKSSFSPSSVKPRYVVQDWLESFEGQIEIHDFEPVGRDAFKRVHHPDMVDAILDCLKVNGFGNRSVDVAKSLPYTTGSMLAAARYAVENNCFTCSPTSGFHHAEFHGPQGFCTFEGMMVTAVLLKEAGTVNSVGIIDCDVHYGNGTADIIRRLGLDWVRHHTMGAKHFKRNDKHADSSVHTQFNGWLKTAIDDVRHCDLVLYQAGADPHIEDPLGGVLTTEQMRHRDELVFSRLNGRALTFNLAGGYQTVDAPTERQSLDPILALHRNTARACLHATSSCVSRRNEQPSNSKALELA